MATLWGFESKNTLNGINNGTEMSNFNNRLLQPTFSDATIMIEIDAYFEFWSGIFWPEAFLKVFNWQATFVLSIYLPPFYAHLYSVVEQDED